MHLDRPVIFPDKDGEPLQALHRRKDRNIIPEDETRIHLHYICDKFFQKLKPNKILTQHVEELKKQQMLQVPENLNEPRMYNFIKIFEENKTCKGNCLMEIIVLLDLELLNTIFQMKTCYYY